MKYRKVTFWLIYVFLVFGFKAIFDEINVAMGSQDSFVMKFINLLIFLFFCVPVVVFRLHISRITISDLIDQFINSSLVVKITAILVIVISFLIVIIAFKK